MPRKKEGGEGGQKWRESRNAAGRVSRVNFRWWRVKYRGSLFLTDDEALTSLLLEMRTVLYRRTLYLKRPLQKEEEK